VPGNNVYLSIDIELQETAERNLAQVIAEINEERKEEETELSEGGAICVVDVNTGEVLALASYPTFDPSPLNPTYDLATFNKTYTTLENDPALPLWNRATQGIYNPGSTYKRVTAYAGLVSLYIDASTEIFDGGKFEKYADTDFTPRCWIYNETGYGHGNENVVTALRDSCNVFFYTVGDTVGYRQMLSAAEEFGFGKKTGIELTEDSGILGTEEYKLKMTGETWYAADTVYAAIGQGYNFLTPIQISNYIATIASNGNVHKTTILSSVKSSDNSVTVYRHEPEIVSTLSHPEYLPLLQQGMREVVTSGTARSAFYGYPIPVAAKTGTVQSDTTEINNGVFVCYAPYEDPQIAISVVVEKGGSGARIISSAQAVMDKYFESSLTFAVVGEGELIP